ncbi:hypothetical protein [Micromonospora sp. NPDC023633]|uniref:hypothetical protein n=1 Tax=Micromonospora sp. NPDC023633 TaxID=3154320 RepID=UPI003410306E
MKTHHPLADHPHTDPGDGRTECDGCGKYVWPVIHSCKGIPVTAKAWARYAQRRERELVDALADCVTKAVEYGEQDGGFVAFYLLPTGPVHRAIALLQERHGVTVRPGFDGRDQVEG